jgi:lipoprotein-anchoring transpeptidase ErfK/SrfK
VILGATGLVAQMKMARLAYLSPPHRRRRSLAVHRGAGGFFLWLFVLLVAGIVGVVWWTSGKSKPPRAQIRPRQLASLTGGPIALPTNPSPRSTVAETNRVTSLSSVPLKTNAASLLATETTNRPGLVLPNSTNGFPRPPYNTLEVQIALARRAISSGSIDGVMGAQTRAALAAFQRATSLAATGELDQATRSTLPLDIAPLTEYVVTSNDLARLQPVSKTWLGKSKQSALDFETILELVAELGHTSPTLMRKLNPQVNWTNIAVGTVVKIPAVESPAPRTKAAFIVISLAALQMQAFDAETNLLAHFPCSIAARVDKRPVGELHVVNAAENPDYTFNPEVFPESEEAQQLKTKLILPPGPNNPVGTAWISLDKPGYGIHGTPSPEQVGRTESHGCFRLANWNATYLLKLVWVGMPVWIEP